MPGPDVEIELPSTLDRSPQEERDTVAATLRSATDEYGDGERDVRASRAHLVELAQQLDVPVTTRMTKAEIAAALEKESVRRTDRARRR